MEFNLEKTMEKAEIEKKKREEDFHKQLNALTEKNRKEQEETQQLFLKAINEDKKEREAQAKAEAEEQARIEAKRINDEIAKKHNLKTEDETRLDNAWRNMLKKNEGNNIYDTDIELKEGIEKDQAYLNLLKGIK